MNDDARCDSLQLRLMLMDEDRTNFERIATWCRDRLQETQDQLEVTQRNLSDMLVTQTRARNDVKNLSVEVKQLKAKLKRETTALKGEVRDAEAMFTQQSETQKEWREKVAELTVMNEDMRKVNKDMRQTRDDAIRWSQSLRAEVKDLRAKNGILCDTLEQMASVQDKSEYANIVYARLKNVYANNAVVVVGGTRVAIGDLRVFVTDTVEWDIKTFLLHVLNPKNMSCAEAKTH